jgi:hypothetical protein
MPDVLPTNGLARRLSVAAVLAAAAVSAPLASARGPAAVDRVPASIPKSGVNVTGVIVLLPGKSVHGLISAGRAVTIAHRNVNPRVWRHATTLRATVPGPVAVAPDERHTSWATLRNAPAWIVTFTATSPQRVSAEPSVSASIGHMSVVLDARNGRFIRGFYTT